MSRLPTWAWWTLGIAAAGGVGYLALRPSRVAATPQLPPQYPDPLLPKTRATVDFAAPSIQGPMPGPDGFTDFFTTEIESKIIADLQNWKIENNVSNCTTVEVLDAATNSLMIHHFEEARLATLDILDSDYPLEDGQLWEATGSAQPEWAKWLFDRVELIAQRVICGFAPVG